MNDSDTPVEIPAELRKTLEADGINADVFVAVLVDIIREHCRKQKD